MWAPWFPLPTIEDLIDLVEPGTCMADNDVGEMFLNFVMHEDLRKLCGIDLTMFKAGSDIPKAVKWRRWCRNAMGLLSSPYLSVQAMLWGQEVILGDRMEVRNVFRWKRIRLNLPGSSDYNPSLVWVRKEREDGSLAADYVCYVDDERTTGPTDEECWKASQRVSSRSTYLGPRTWVYKTQLVREEGRD
jgi:hypothetical protein